MFKKVIAACALSTVALGAAACGTAQAAPPSAETATGSAGSATGTATPSGGASASASASTAASASAAQTKAASGSTSSTTSAKTSPVPACGGDDLKIYFGYGTQSDPVQANAVVFKNISTRTCTLQGYPGAAIEDSGTVINAARVLNGFRGSLPPLSSPPLVTLAPGGVAYSVLEWSLHTSQSCYPTGTGTFEITAPNTTRTVVIGTSGHMGTPGICSTFEVNPIVPGTFGVSVGS